jgi:hypothetical protein
VMSWRRLPFALFRFAALLAHRLTSAQSSTSSRSSTNSRTDTGTFLKRAGIQ